MEITRERRRAGDLHVSKSSIGLFERCPLAYRYEKVDRQAPDFDDAPGEALLVGNAGHEAVARLLGDGYAELDVAGINKAIEEVLGGYGLRPSARERVAEWADEAAALAAARTGEARWIEELKTMVRIPGLTVWGKFDVAIAGGCAAPLEIIDWTFGRTRANSEADLAAAIGTVIYRLIAGAHEPELRPIAITEVHVPTMTTITVIPTDDEVRAGWERLKVIAGNIEEAIEQSTFPPRTGGHCSYCAYRASCPAVAAGSNVVPL